MYWKAVLGYLWIVDLDGYDKIFKSKDISFACFCLTSHDENEAKSIVLHEFLNIPSFVIELIQILLEAIFSAIPLKINA